MGSDKLFDEKMSRRGLIKGAAGVAGISAFAAGGTQECPVYCRPGVIQAVMHGSEKKI